MRSRSVGLLALCSVLGGVTGLAFDGRIVTPSGAPVAGARVQVLGRPGSVVADSQGRFVLTPDPQVPFSLLISRPDGVSLRPVAVQTLPAGPLEVVVEPALSETLTVVSSATADLELPPAAAFSLVGRADLEERAPQQLADVLEATPGALGLERSHDAVPAIRGMTGSRTLILLDDGRVTAERRAGASATFLDPLTLDEVEVVRGPGSVAYGSDAFGGVIRARTRIPGPDEPLALRYAAGAATGTGEKLAAAEVGVPIFGGGLLAGISYRDCDDYDAPNGEVYNSAAEFTAMRVGFQRPVLGGNLRVLWRTDLGRDIGKPAADSRVTRSFYPEENSHRFTLHFDGPGPEGWSRIGVTAAWDRYQILTDRDRFPTAAAARQLTEADVDAQDYGLRVEAERALGPARLILGIDGSGRFGLSATNTTFRYDTTEALVSTSRELSIDSARRDDLAAFAGLSRTIGAVSLAAAVRIDRVTSSNSGGYFGDRDTADTALSGFAAATIGLPAGLELSAQAARGFRDPLLSDRYYRGISGRGFITGNPDLEAETSQQLDAALRWVRGPWRVALYGFHYRIRDLVERYRSGSDYFFRNRGTAKLIGAEFEAGVELGHGIQLQAGLQTERGEVADDGTPTDGIPPRGGFLAVRLAPDGRWWWLARVAALERDDRPGPTERVVPGYAVVDAGFGYRLAPALEIELHGRNLLDRDYPGSADAAAVSAPGRSVQLALRGVI